jgi:hypothetical protein
MAPSAIDIIRGAYGDVGSPDWPLVEGDPSPVMPETLYLLLPDEVDICGRTGGSCEEELARPCILDEELELTSPEGGVLNPFAELRVEDDFVAGTPPLLSLLESVDRAVRKLDLLLRRSSLKKVGAILGRENLSKRPMSIACQKRRTLGRLEEAKIQIHNREGPATETDMY